MCFDFPYGCAWPEKEFMGGIGGIGLHGSVYLNWKFDFRQTSQMGMEIWWAGRFVLTGNPRADAFRK
jgi:hypothetical protein